ncbi:hypothetical protein [Frankia sp. CiP3]|uniref:hypothetical protein n=1 Tax=Frankia sp. CiP3 TaxID=2880971 RepID=UPI001EF46185|nr:hypothetical protein [Frankia sp. CiP3]
MTEERQGVDHGRAAKETSSVRGTQADRPAKIPRQPALRPIVDGVETVPMTADEHQSAVFALVTLIAHWEQLGCPTSPSDKQDRE